MTSVSVRLPARPLTLDDVAELAGGDPDHRYELQEGNLLVMPPADEEHAEMIMRIGAWLMTGGYAGRVLAAPGIRAGSSGRSPDVVVRRFPPAGRAIWIDPADVLLTIEIVSPVRRDGLGARAQAAHVRARHRGDLARPPGTCAGWL